jgi:type I restriction enzyme, S subunit
LRSFGSRFSQPPSAANSSRRTRTTSRRRRCWRAKNKNVEPASELLKRIRTERRKKWEQAELAKLNAKGKPPTDDKWKAKYKEPAPVDTTGLPELPKGWCWASVEELSTKVVDGVHKKPAYVAAGVPFLTVKNLTAGPL